MSQSSDMQEVFLHPGEFAIGTETCIIHTLLGSCVAITLWHPVHKIGAMSHFILPSNTARAFTPPNPRYGDDVLGLMAKELERAGVNFKECEAKIFGGGNMFPHQEKMDANNIGQKNGEMARKQLRDNHIPILSESLFGYGHRKVVLNIKTGEVLSKHIKPDPSNDITRETTNSFEKIFKANCFEISKLIKI